MLRLENEYYELEQEYHEKKKRYQTSQDTLHHFQKQVNVKTEEFVKYIQHIYKEDTTQQSRQYVNQLLDTLDYVNKEYRQQIEVLDNELMKLKKDYINKQEDIARQQQESKSRNDSGMR
ncbi:MULTISPECIES: hypothetical protein [unclassified Granulicatella]|uniref:hypothetical protein n=1 Tax=unclassified Granulicatella TaxID=2630493 RepID=UPI00107431B9|nr:MULTISPECIES: hypothetical protein [unclassified Granulicatella]MBF0780567.1 hypothetical protein [Granulicatella sp. 19428wC4_WM01]TFU94919.1 hypothetical protein E4T68_05595 [Granulicatella sp. WM01]